MANDFNNMGFTWSPEALKAMGMPAEDAQTSQENAAEVKKELPDNCFYMGIRDIFPVEGTEDLTVVGLLHGTIHVGDSVNLVNMGEDEPKVYQTVVNALELDGGKKADVAKEEMVAVVVKNGTQCNIKVGTVIYTENADISNVQQAFVASLGDVYVARADLDLSEETLASLSIAECAEIWRLHSLHMMRKTDLTEEVKDVHRERVYNLCCALCDKILAADSIFTVMSKQTGEPYMFSRTMVKDNQFAISMPEILVVPKAYKVMMETVFPKDKFEFVEVKNGEEGKGISKFLEYAFYSNGAEGIRVIGEQVVIAAARLVEKPDYEGVDPEDIPVSNPNFQRWVLLQGQMERPKEGTPAERVQLFNVYTTNMFKESVRAKFLVPMREYIADCTVDENGFTVFPEGANVSFAVLDGRNGKPAISLYSDEKKLKRYMGENCNYFIRPVGGVVNEKMDAILNASPFSQTNVYMTNEMIDKIMSMEKK